MTGAGESAGHRMGAERAMQRSFAALVLLFGADWASTVVATPSLVRPLPLILVGGQLLAWVVLCGRAWRGRLDRRDAFVCGAVAICVFLALPDVSVIAAGTRVQVVVVPAVLAAGFLTLVPAGALIAGLAGAYLASVLPATGTTAISDLWPMLAAAVAAAVLAPTLRTAGGAADREQEELVRSRAAEAAAEGRRAAFREFQRMLHDHVTAALRVVALGLGNPAEVRRTCQTAIEALHAESLVPEAGTTELGTFIKEAAEVAATPVDLRVERRFPVPTGVGRAVALAVEEALRNVDRHARASRVSVTLEARGDGFVVTVADDGTGMGQGAGLGQRRSIDQRMADIGGSATITASPGSGTTVVLSWSPERVERPGRIRLLRMAVGDVRPALAAVCVPYLAGTASVIVVRVAAGACKAILVGWFTILVAFTMALLWRAGRENARGTTVAAGMALFALGVAGLVLMPAGGFAGGLDSWPVGAVGPALVVLAVTGPPWEAGGVCLGEIVFFAGFAWMRSPGPVPLAPLVPVVLAPLFGTAMGTVMAMTVRRYGRIVLSAQAQQFAVLEIKARRDGVAALRRERADELARDMAPFLQDILTESIDPRAEPVRARAAELEQMARDELHLPGVLDTRTRALLRVARQRGSLIRFHIDSDTMAVPHVVPDLLRAALAESAPRQLTVSSYPQDGRMLVSLVVIPGNPGLAARLSGIRAAPLAVESDDEATFVEFVA